MSRWPPSRRCRRDARCGGCPIDPSSSSSFVTHARSSSSTPTHTCESRLMYQQLDRTDVLLIAAGLVGASAAGLYLVAGITCWISAGGWVDGTWTDGMGGLVHPNRK